MRPGMIAAAFGALLFTASQAAYAAPAVNLQGAVQSPAGSVDLVAQGRGGKGPVGAPNVRAYGGGGPKARAYGGGGPKMSARGPKPGAYRGGNPGRYAGKGPRGGDWNRGVKRGGYAWRGRDKNRYRYFYPGVGLGLGLAYGGAYAYGDDCGWLYRRAQATGSPYWWSRFEECRYSYY